MERKTDRFPDIIAKAISVIFHPLLMPLYGLLIIFSAPTLFGFLPDRFKNSLLMVIFVNNILLPLLLMPYYRYRGIITSWTVNNREERSIPLFATTFFYFVTTYIVIRYQVPVFIKSFILSATVLSLLISVINFRLKVSIHAAGAGAIMALIIILSLRMHTQLTGLLISSVFASGLILSSRLWLDSHTPGEVWTGFFLGVVVPGIMLSIF